MILPTDSDEVMHKAMYKDLISKMEFEVKLLQASAAEASLAEFVKQAWHIIEPETKLTWNWHLDTMCVYLEHTVLEIAAARGVKHITRLIINVPPGTMKSIIVGVMFPAWLWARDPGKRILGVSNAQDLAIRDSRRTKQILTDEWYQEKWALAFQADQSAKTNYENERGGFRVSLGMTANITGKRGDYVLIDDPLDARDAQSDVKRKACNEIYDEKLSTRINSRKESVIILIMQRLHHEDLSGHLLQKKYTDWTHVVMPMHYDSAYTFDANKDLMRPDLDDPRTDDELLFPKLFPESSVKQLEEDMGSHIAAGQLEQRPSAKGGGILKQHWFRVWDESVDFPRVEHIFISWDTAYSEKDLENNAYSACTSWGVFWNPNQERENVILLDMWYDRVDYPELRRKAMDMQKDKRPDTMLIEKKASGISLVQDLRQAGVFVKTYQPDRDKVSRAYSIQSMLESGQIWIPDRKWAHQFAYLMGTFPTGELHSTDLTDTFTQAMIYIRNGSYINHPDTLWDHHDEQDAQDRKHRKRSVSAYGRSIESDTSRESDDIFKGVSGSDFQRTSLQ